MFVLNVLLNPINLFPYSVHWYTLCRLHYYKLSLLREGGAERMEIATEAVNTLKLSLLNYLESRYLSTLYPTIKTNVLTARIYNILPLLSDPSPSLPACIPAPDQHIYLFPAGHSGPERDDNSHHQSVQTLKLLTLQLKTSAVFSSRVRYQQKIYIIFMKSPASLLPLSLPFILGQT